MATKLVKLSNLKQFYTQMTYHGRSHFALCNSRLSTKVNDGSIPYGPDQKPWRETLSHVAVSPTGKLLVSPPFNDPLVEYKDVMSKVTGPFYQVPSLKLSDQQQNQAQKETLNMMQTQKANFLGYQANQCMQQNLQWLQPYLGFHSNNIGDPFTAGNFTMNTKWMECNVLDYYASLWNGKWPHNPGDPDTYWGYVLTMGSTEGNLYAAWNARDYLSGKCLFIDKQQLRRAFQEAKSGKKRIVSIPYGYTYGKARLANVKDGEQNENAFSPVVFYSEDTHYSNIKATQTIDIPTFYSVGTEKYPGQCPIPTHDGNWPSEVPSKDGALGPGTIDTEALKKLVEFFVSKGHPAYIVLNYGTTFKGTFDDVNAVGRELEPIFKKYNMYDREIVLPDGSRETRRGFWIHVDGALGASYMPFIRMAVEQGQLIQEGITTPGPQFDFQLDFVSSIVTSGHKWIGSPSPNGVYMMRNKYRIKPPEDTPIYVGSPDTTFAGSRSALHAAELWTYISTHSYDDQIRKVIHCISMANYAHQQLKQLQSKIPDKDIWVTRSSPYSLSLFFRKPNEKIVSRYSLSSENLMVGGEFRVYSHIYMMEHVTTSRINQLLFDLSLQGAFPDHDQEPALSYEEAEKWLESHDSIESTSEYQPHPLIMVPTIGRGYK